MSEVDEFLAHYGVKGMRWGVMRDLKRLSPADRVTYLAQKDAAWKAKVNADPKLGKIQSKAARLSKKRTKELNQDFKARGINLRKDALERNRYDMELKSLLQRSLDEAAYKVHKYPPSRLFEVQIHRHPDGSITSMVAQRHNTKIVKQQGKLAKIDRRVAKKEAKAALSHADDSEADDMPDYEDLRFVLAVDPEGYVVDVQSTAGKEFEHMEDVDEFLAHYGVKGMRWGVRRSDAQLSLAAKLRNKLSRKKDPEEGDDATGGSPSSGGSSASKKDAKEAEAAKDIHISADAERFIKTRQKQGHEMSDREIKEALNRARIVKEYNEMFSPGPNADLKAKVEALRLQRDYASLKAEMNPSKVKKVKGFLDTANEAYSSYQKLNEATGGRLAKQLNGAFKSASGGKHRK